MCSKLWARKPPVAAAGVVHGLANTRVYHLHHCLDYLARREELPAIIALLAHLEQQPFVDLREREDVRRIDRLVRELMHFVEHIEEVALSVDADPLDAGHNLADDLLPRGGVGRFLECLQMRQQFGIDEVEKGIWRCVLELLPLVGFAFRWRPSRASGRAFLGKVGTAIPTPRPPALLSPRARRGCAGRESTSVRARTATRQRNCPRRMMSQMLLTA